MAGKKSAKPTSPPKTIRALADLRPDPLNARLHNEPNIEMLERSLKEVGAARSIVVDEDGMILAGHGVVEAAAKAGVERVRTVEADGSEIIAVVRRGLTDDQKRRLALYDNRTAELSEWNPEMLRALIASGTKLDGIWNDNALALLLQANGNETSEAEARRTLAERFIVPPFSVLDARQGYWQERKRAWLALGIQSELGRGEGLTPSVSPQVTEPGLNFYRRQQTNKQSQVFNGEALRRGGEAADPLERKRQFDGTDKSLDRLSPGGSPEPLARLRMGRQSIMGDNQKKLSPGAARRAPLERKRQFDGRTDGHSRALEGVQEPKQINRAAKKQSPGGSPRPACDYRQNQREDGRGRVIDA